MLLSDKPGIEGGLAGRLRRGSPDRPWYTLEINTFKSILKSWCWRRIRSLTSWFTWTIDAPERSRGLYWMLNWLHEARILPEKLSGSQLLKKLPEFHGTPKVHHHIHKNTLPALVVSQTSPLNTTGFKLAKQKVDIAMLFFQFVKILCCARSWHLVHTLCLCDWWLK